MILLNFPNILTWGLKTLIHFETITPLLRRSKAWSQLLGQLFCVPKDGSFQIKILRLAISHSHISLAITEPLNLGVFQDFVGKTIVFISKKESGSQESKTFHFLEIRTTQHKYTLRKIFLRSYISPSPTFPLRKNPDFLLCP